MTLLERLQEHAGSKKKVMLMRFPPFEETHHGFLLSVGDTWTLLWRFSDFDPDGFEILRTEQITDIRSGKFERKWEQMLKDEGALDSWPTLELPLGDTFTLVADLQNRGEFIEVELENADHLEQTFFIGRIVTHDKHLLRFAHFDGEGVWRNKSYTIGFSDITCMRFKTPYAETFAKYLSGGCPVE